MPDDTAAVTATSPAPGPLSTWLSQQGFDHAVLPPDHLGVEVIGVEPAFLPLVVTALKPPRSLRVTPLSFSALAAKLTPLASVSPLCTA